MAGEHLVGEVPEGWEYTTLGEACVRGGGDIQTGPFGSQLHAADYVDHGVPSIMPQNIGDNRVVREGIAQITLEDAKRLSRYRVRTGDIVYSRRGDVERRALIRETENGWLCGTGCLRLRFGEGHVNPTFASYYLSDERVREWVVRHAHGATMPNLNTSILSELPFVVPPPGEQCAIAHMLGTLDDKIELNRRMNETLEAMARALFKSWFVDFDPVHAKAEGRQPARMDAKTTALFPDSFQDSTIGGIPKGWSVVPIGDAVKVVGGSTPRTEEPSFWNGGIAFATPKDMAGLSAPALLHTERTITERGLSQIGSGILPKGTVLLSSRAPIGYLAIAEIPVAVNQGIVAMVCEGTVPNQYVLQWARENLDTIIGNANGTTFLEISKRNFRPIPVLVPTDDVLRAFEALADPFHERVISNLKESETLATLRDALLPKLLTGEVCVQKGM